jgi:hypothetical protein
MAINFLNSLNFNSIQVENIVIENFASDVLAGTGVSGQLYWNTTAESLYGWDGTASAWIPIGTQADVLTFTGDSGGDQTVDLNAQTFTVAGTSNEIKTAGAGQTLTISLADGAFNATPGAGTNLELPDGTAAITQNATDNTTKVATTAYVTTAVAASDTLAEVLAIGNTTSGTDIAISAGDDITFTATSAIIDSGASAGTNLQYLSSTGTTIDWLDLPVDPNEKYTLPVAAGAANSAVISLTGDTDGVVSTVDFIGTTGRIAITEQTGNNGSITIDFPDDVIIVDDLTVNGIITQSETGETNSFASPLNMNTNKLTGVATGTASTDGVNLGQVELLVAGVGVFKGGYNATTDPGVPVISGGSNIALDQGDYYVVSHDGDITFSGTSTTGVNDGALTSSTALLLTAANTDIAVGMDVTGTGVPPGITIATVTDSSNFVLSSAITIANTTTLTFSDKVVSVEVGDFIFANAAITASSDPAASAYTIVQSDANIAGAGATDGATEKGVSGFDSANFDVSASGWVQLKSQANANGRKQTLNNTSPCARVYTNGLTTFTIDLADTTLFGTSALAENVTAEVTQHVSPFQTVYADVTRSGSASMSIIFSGDVAVDLYRVLLTHI